MARMQFTRNTRYELHHHMYLIQGELPHGRFLVENLTMAREERPSVQDLTDFWQRGELVFVPKDGQPHTDTAQSMVIRSTRATFDELPEEYRAEARRRLELLVPLLRLPPAQRTRAAIADHAATLTWNHAVRPDHKRARLGRAASRGSLERWLHDYEESGCDIRALVPGCCERRDTGKHSLPDDVEGCIQTVLQECKQQPAHRRLEDVNSMVVTEVTQLNRFRPPDQQLQPPSASTVQRRVSACGAVTILRRRASRLETQAEQPYLPGPRPTRILERVEIDSTPLDLFVVDEDDRFPIGRPTLTYALDVYSGFPLGVYVGFERHSYRSVMNCLLHSILPKVDTCALYGTKHPWLAYGLPELLVVDNDRPFVNHHLKDACGQLGIILEELPVETPWFKGKIERFFQTNNTGLIHGLPGTTFSNIVMRGDYKALECACISLKEFVRLLHIFVLDEYAQDKHTDLGIIPAHRWNESLQAGFVPFLPESVETTRIRLYCSATRTVGRHGIDFEALRYQSRDLQRMHRRRTEEDGPSQDREEESSQTDDVARVLPNRKRVQFKYDPGNIQCIYVTDPDQHKPVAIPAVDPLGYTVGLSIWKHRIVRKNALALYGKADIYDLANACNRIRQIVEDAFKKTRRTRTRATAARFLEIGTGPLPTPDTSSAAAPALEASTTSDTPKMLPEPQAPPLRAPHATQAAGSTRDTPVTATPTTPDTPDTPAIPATPDQPGDQTAATTNRTTRRASRSPKNTPPSASVGASTPAAAPDLSRWGADYDLPREP